jgi:biotin operon repressor
MRREQMAAELGVSERSISMYLDMAREWGADITSKGFPGGGKGMVLLNGDEIEKAGRVRRWLQLEREQMELGIGIDVAI